MKRKLFRKIKKHASRAFFGEYMRVLDLSDKYDRETDQLRAEIVCWQNELERVCLENSAALAGLGTKDARIAELEVQLECSAGSWVPVTERLPTTPHRGVSRPVITWVRGIGKHGKPVENCTFKLRNGNVEWRYWHGDVTHWLDVTPPEKQKSV